MHNADAQCTLEERERDQRSGEKFLCLNFSCLTLNYEFYFIISMSIFCL